MKLCIDEAGDYWVADEHLAVFIGEDIADVARNFDRCCLSRKRADVKYDLREV